MEITEITRETYLHLAHLFCEFWPDLDLDDELDYCHKMISNPEETGFLVNDNDEFVGFLHLKVRHDHVEGSDEDAVAYLEGIYLRKGYQKSGIGRKLIEIAEKWALSMGFKQLASDVEIDNQNSIDFHKHLGFKEQNRVVCFIKNLP